MLTLALPKGRLATALTDFLESAGLELEPAYFADADRRLIYATADPEVRVVPVKPFDVATLVAGGGADLGVVGADVLEEFDFSELYAPLAFGFGACRLSVAGPQGFEMPAAGQSVCVATKYPRLTQAYFESLGISPSLTLMSGGMELAPLLGMADCIVDLVSTGATLAANQLIESDVILHSSARLIVSRQAHKTKGARLHELINQFRAIAQGQSPSAA